MIGCQSTPNSEPTQLPVEQVAADPEPVPEQPDPEPAPPPMTWDEVRTALPETNDYAQITLADPPAWLGEVDTVWVRVGKQCRPIALAPEPDEHASLEQCHEVVRKADVTCTVAVEVGRLFRPTGPQFCDTELPSGGGSGSATFGVPDNWDEAWSLVAANELELRYAKTWALAVEADHLMWVEYACSADSVAALDEALIAEGISEQARPELLNQRHGVVGHARRCLERVGIRLDAWSSEAGNRGDRGAGVRSEPGTHDCALPCPDTAQDLRRINAVLTTQRFVRIDDNRSLVVHRTRPACEATVDGGLPALAKNPCR
ncbi:hypothetical protein [Enhygromyxa salina]|uniref:hypothetical protein n=1 Tax=Enhygromyxa salina TaxID=215803 RepID=UPI000D038D42|nr:hypothetical protein [Enhygromyxa salina]